MIHRRIPLLTRQRPGLTAAMLLWIMGAWGAATTGLTASALSTDAGPRPHRRARAACAAAMPKQHLPAALQLGDRGVVTRADLVGAGLNEDLGDRQHRSGSGARLAPSTYVLTTASPSHVQLVLAALERAGTDCVITGLEACRALGLPDVPDDGSVEALVPAGRRRVSSPRVRVQPTTRPPGYWVKDDVRYAEPCRAVIDAARRLTTLRAIRALVMGAVNAHVCTPDELMAELDAGRRGGSALCRRAVGDAAAGARSAPEAEVADVAARAVREGRLPSFLLNPTLLMSGTVVGEPDGWLVGLGLGWEVDSRRHHGSDDDFDATLARHDRFAAHGLVLLHVTPKRARLLGARYADVLVDAAAARGAIAQPEPPGLVVTSKGPLPPLLGRLPCA